MIKKAISKFVPKNLTEIEKEYIKLMLNYYEGNKTLAAKALKISRSTILRKIKKYNIN